MTREMALGNYSAHFSPQPVSVIHLTDLSGTGLSERSDSLPSPYSQLQTQVQRATQGRGAWLPVRQPLQGASGLLLGLRGHLRGAKYVPLQAMLTGFHFILGLFSHMTVIGKG